MAITIDDTTQGSVPPKPKPGPNLPANSNPYTAPPGGGGPNYGGTGPGGQGNFLPSQVINSPTQSLFGQTFVVKPGDPNFSAAIASALATIKSIESGGSYTARNPHSTASGAYQFIDSTWNNYGGYAHAYLAPPSVQDAKAKQLVTYILMAHGYDFRWIPAVWYAGPSGAMSHNWGTYVPSPGAGNTLTIGGYVNKWMTTLTGQPDTAWAVDNPAAPIDPATGQPTGPGTQAIDPQPYIDQARLYGMTITKAQGNLLIKNLVSLTEWDSRLQVNKRLSEQGKLLDAFGAVLKARGLVKDPNLTLKERIAYLSGAAPAQWYNVSKEFSVRADAINSGLAPGGTGEFGISRSQLLGIMNRQPGMLQEGALAGQFGQLAQDFKTLIPQGRWTGFGITKSDLIALEFGSSVPGQQVNAAEKVQKAVNTYQAAQQPRANPQSFVTQGGPAESGYGGLGGGGATQ